MTVANIPGWNPKKQLDKIKKQRQSGSGRGGKKRKRIGRGARAKAKAEAKESMVGVEGKETILIPAT